MKWVNVGQNFERSKLLSKLFSSILKLTQILKYFEIFRNYLKYLACCNIYFSVTIIYLTQVYQQYSIKNIFSGYLHSLKFYKHCDLHETYPYCAIQRL